MSLRCMMLSSVTIAPPSVYFRSSSTSLLSSRRSSSAAGAVPLIVAQPRTPLSSVRNRAMSATTVASADATAAAGATSKHVAPAPDPRTLTDHRPGGPVSPSKRHGFGVLKKGAPLEKWEFTVEPAMTNEVDIRVTHNGLCHTDIHMRDNDWGLSGFPFIPGHEIVGEVVDIGGGTAPAHGLQVGQRVGVGWIKSSCERCAHCLRGEVNICREGPTPINAFGGLGGFADYVRVPHTAVYTIPDALESVHAAPLLCAGLTVFAPLRRHLRTGMRVAVIGLGGLGHLAVQFAAHMGASEVVAVDPDMSKAGEARVLGATELITFETYSKSSHGRFDLVLNTAPVDLNKKPKAQKPAPKAATAEGGSGSSSGSGSSGGGGNGNGNGSGNGSGSGSGSGEVEDEGSSFVLEPLASNGTFVQLGIPGGSPILKVPLIPLVFSQKTIVGSIVGSRNDMQECLNFAAAKGIKPMVETMPLNKVNEAFERLAAGKPRYRIVLVSDASSLAELQKDEEEGEGVHAGGNGHGKGNGNGNGAAAAAAGGSGSSEASDKGAVNKADEKKR